jgi:hypothetical protein
MHIVPRATQCSRALSKQNASTALVVNYYIEYTSVTASQNALATIAMQPHWLHAWLQSATVGDHNCYDDTSCFSDAAYLATLPQSM